MAENATARVLVTARDGGRFQAYLATPPSGRGPGIVLMQEIFGVNASMRQVAEGYAARGFTVICPDLFWRQEPGVELTDRTDAEWQKAFGYMKGMDQALAIGGRLGQGLVQEVFVSQRPPEAVGGAYEARIVGEERVEEVAPEARVTA